MRSSSTLVMLMEATVMALMRRMISRQRKKLDMIWPTDCRTAPAVSAALRAI